MGRASGKCDNIALGSVDSGQCGHFRMYVHTVDSFQGREADIVVLSCVRDGTRGLGFVDDDRRMTVALSRARKRLEIVASKTDMWPRESVVRRVMDMI